MSNFLENKFLAASKVTNKQNTFIKPTPQGSPVLTLGIYCKGQGRTTFQGAPHHPEPLGHLVTPADSGDGALPPRLPINTSLTFQEERSQSTLYDLPGRVLVTI